MDQTQNSAQAMSKSAEIEKKLPVKIEQIECKYLVIKCKNPQKTTI